jgi:hypothetical protein
MGCFEDFMEFREEVERLKRDRLKRAIADVHEGSTAAALIEESL